MFFQKEGTTVMIFFNRFLETFLVFVMLFFSLNCSDKRKDETGISPKQAPQTAESQSNTTNDAADNFEGTLKLYGEWGAIEYLGEESGDWVPYFFKIDSPAGKMILSACKEGDYCACTGNLKTMEKFPEGIDVSGASEINEIVEVASIKAITQ